jgi:hypothetical protein
LAICAGVNAGDVLSSSLAIKPYRGVGPSFEKASGHAGHAVRAHAGGKASIRAKRSMSPLRSPTLRI